MGLRRYGHLAGYRSSVAATQGADSAQRKSDLFALFTVIILVIGFSLSDDIVEFALDVTGHSHSAAPWLVFSLDCLLVAGTAVLKWQVGGEGGRNGFLRQLVCGSWGLGAILVIGGHVFLVNTSGHRAQLSDVAAVWLTLGVTAVFVAGMSMLLLAALAGARAPRDWLAPLVIGTFTAQVASALWYPVIDRGDGCAGNVASGYFADMANILAILLLTLGMEVNFLRRRTTHSNPGQRVAPAFTVLYVCIALGLSFTMEVKGDKDTLCGMGAVWHEYISFVITIQALAIGLTTLVWLMLAEAIAPDPDS